MHSDNHVTIRGLKLAKTFPVNGQPVMALTPSDFTLRPNEMVAIVGPSGSGKTTLLSILGLLLRPSEGELRFLDVDTATLTDAQLSRFRNEKIGFVFQSSVLLPHLNALDNVLLPAWARRRNQSRKTLYDRGRALLNQVGLGHRFHHLPKQLSGGEQQRVAIARALMMNPQVIIADEPTGSLNDEQTQQIIKLLNQIAHVDNRSVIIATHDAQVAKSCDRTVSISATKEGIHETV